MKSINTNTRENNSWRCMLARCTNPTNKDWKYYGERGVVVCNRWHKFDNFVCDMGVRPDKCSLDRIDPTGNYSCGSCDECISNGWPLNCKWSTTKEQANNKRATIKLTLDGITRSLSEWSNIKGVSYTAVISRYKRGVSLPDLFSKTRLIGDMHKDRILRPVYMKANDWWYVNINNNRINLNVRGEDNLDAAASALATLIESDNWMEISSKKRKKREVGRHYNKTKKG